MIDSHCHLDFKHFDGIRDEVVTEAVGAGVHTIVNIGTDLATSKKSIEFAERFESVYATVGVHPHDAKTLDDRTFDELSDLVDHERVVAVGEIGLDYYRNLSPKDVQRKAFERQLELAVDKKMPIVIHTRESFEDTFDIVKRFAFDLPGGVFHCFPGDKTDAQRVFELGFIISVGGVITFKNSSMSRMVAEVPLDKVMLETDAPFLTPVPYRGKTNRPSYVRYVRDKLAELHGLAVAEVENVTDRTARKFYSLVETFGG
ncbi:YchF/TatD family DNA exonuclease [candidate division GN15 bacterium]|nr:YchF/TatD family DNA exonuclease [candidate division GN15 bacterium]